MAQMALASAVFTMGTTLLQARQASFGATEEAYALELEGKQDEVATIAREADRKYELSRILASQEASAGARNIAFFEGSPLAVMKEDIRREEEYTERDKYEADLRRMVNKRKQKNIIEKAKWNNVFGLLGAGSQLAGSMPSMGTSMSGSGMAPVAKKMSQYNPGGASWASKGK